MKNNFTTEELEHLKTLIAPKNMKEFENLMGVDKPMFRKEDFRFGDKVRIRRGDISFVITNWRTEDGGIEKFGLFCKLGAVRASRYNDELCNKKDMLGDIVEIYRPKGNYIPLDLANNCMEDYDLIWSRD